MRFIILIYKKGIMDIEVSLKYFFIQGVGSALLLGLVILNTSFLKEIIILVMRYKMGAGPFFFWFPSFCEGIRWLSCILVMSLQKIIPLVAARIFLCSFMWVVLLLRIGLGVAGCFREVKLKKFLAYSSVHYVGWIFLCITRYSYLWLLYLLGYIFILAGVLISLGSDDILIIKDFLKSENPFLFFFRILNLGGMPPLLGFFLKWWVFLSVLNLKVWLISLILIFAVSIFYMYIRLVYRILVDCKRFFLFVWEDKNLFNFKKEISYLSGILVSPFVGWVVL